MHSTQCIAAVVQAAWRGVRYTGGMAEPETSAPDPREPAAQPEPATQPEPAAPAGTDPEFLRFFEAKLRAIPLWLVLAGALALGLAAGGVAYLVRGVLGPLLAHTP
jgi:hypothetical protein